MKHFVPINKLGNVEMSEKQLKSMLSDAYKEGYVQGQIDHILNNAPDFAIAEARQEQSKKKFSENGKTFIFRATIV
jgi:hypothetical protein